VSCDAKLGAGGMTGVTQQAALAATAAAIAMRPAQDGPDFGCTECGYQIVLPEPDIRCPMCGIESWLPIARSRQLAQTDPDQEVLAETP
jgi:predicted RNA-binding Zn-ribbon protein involved in translation (DUF1610 family)